MLEVIDLHVKVGGREVVKGVNLLIGREEVHVLMGPNACGKTSLAMAIIGHPLYEISKGKILFEGQDLAGKSMWERVRLGLAISYQHPPEVRGVKLRDLIRILAGEKPWSPFKEPEEKIASLYLNKVGLCPAIFLRRDINVGFSGGERKRSELAQILAMKPKLIILDEIDSGVDIDSLRLISHELNKLLEETKSSAFIITHYRYILQYLKSHIVHIMYEGQIVRSGDPEKIVPEIEERGYEAYLQEVL